MKFFFIEVEPYGYGASFYCVVSKVDNVEEAAAKVRKKFPKPVRQSHSTSPCEIVFDEDGVSNLLEHQW